MVFDKVYKKQTRKNQKSQDCRFLKLPHFSPRRHPLREFAPHLPRPPLTRGLAKPLIFDWGIVFLFVSFPINGQCFLIYIKIYNTFHRKHNLHYYWLLPRLAIEWTHWGEHCTIGIFLPRNFQLSISTFNSSHGLCAEGFLTKNGKFRYEIFLADRW